MFFFFVASCVDFRIRIFNWTIQSNMFAANAVDFMHVKMSVDILYNLITNHRKHTHIYADLPITSKSSEGYHMQICDEAQLSNTSF